MTISRKAASGLDARPSLPVHGAFVVRLRADSDVTATGLAGRVEHVVTAASTDFGSIDELLAFMAATLRDGRRD